MTAPRIAPAAPPIEYPTPPPMNEPATPNAIVIQIGIGSGPGIANRASAPTTKPLRSMLRTNWSVKTTSGTPLDRT